MGPTKTQNTVKNVNDAENIDTGKADNGACWCKRATKPSKTKYVEDASAGAASDVVRRLEIQFNTHVD